MLKFKTKIEKKKKLKKLKKRDCANKACPSKLSLDAVMHRVKCSLLAQVSHSDSPNVWKLWPSTWSRKQTTSPTANSGWRAGCWATMTPEFRLFLLKFLPLSRAIKRDSAFRVWTWTCFWSVALTFDGCWSPSDFYTMLLLLHLQLKNRCNAVRFLMTLEN